MPLSKGLIASSPVLIRVALSHPNCFSSIPPQRFPKMAQLAYARTGAGADIATAAAAEAARFRTAISCNDGSPLLCQLARALLQCPVDTDWCLTLYKLAREEDGNLVGMCYMGYCMEQLHNCTEQARWFFEQDIHHNNCNVARYALAESLSEAHDASRDYGRAVELYEQVMAQVGFNLVARKLGGLIDMGKGCAKDGRRVVQLYEWAIENGQSCEAMYLLARVLIEGRDDVERDLNRAIQLLERAVREGENVNAMNSLALLLQGGDGVQQDLDRAKALLEKAIEGGNVYAMNNLALMIENENAKRAVQLYEQAIQGANQMAMRNLGRLLMRGSHDVNVDKNRALQLFDKLQDELWLSVRFDVAVLLSGGEGVKEDLKRARMIYEQILEDENNVAAMFNLAAILADGSAGGKDVGKAKGLYERAIEEGGDVLSMINLGLLLAENGDRSQGVRWLERAIEGGRNEAKYYLARVLAGFDGEAVDVGRAVQLFEESVEEMQHIGAMNGLAVLLDRGVGDVERDVERAVRLSEMGVAIGLGADTELEQFAIDRVELREEEECARVREHEISIGAHYVSMLNLAELLLSGKVERNVERALKLCERALSGKEAEELCRYIELDDLLEEVEGMVRSGVGEEEAVRICELAINATTYNTASCGHALRILARLTLRGVGIQRDTEGAAQLYKKAAEKGDAEAALEWADCLMYGFEDVETDEKLAFDMYASVLQIGVGNDFAREAATKMAFLVEGNAHKERRRIHGRVGKRRRAGVRMGGVSVIGCALGLFLFDVCGFQELLFAGCRRLLCK